MNGSAKQDLTQVWAGKLTTAPLQFDMSADLGAPPETVFDVIADFENMPDWMPVMNRVEVDNTNAEKPGQVGSVRVIYAPLAPKPTLEPVKAFERPNVLSYGATDESLMGMYTDHTGILTCVDNGQGGTTFRWATYARPGRNPIMRFFGRLMFKFMFSRSIRNLEKRFPVG